MWCVSHQFYCRSPLTHSPVVTICPPSARLCSFLSSQLVIHPASVHFRGHPGAFCGGCRPCLPPHHHTYADNTQKRVLEGVSVLLVTSHGWSKTVDVCRFTSVSWWLPKWRSLSLSASHWVLPVVYFTSSCTHTSLLSQLQSASLSCTLASLCYI